MSFVLSEEVDSWLLFDDTSIRVVGGWGEVVSSITRDSLQPLVLFYEEAPAKGG